MTAPKHVRRARLVPGSPACDEAPSSRGVSVCGIGRWRVRMQLKRGRRRPQRRGFSRLNERRRIRLWKGKRFFERICLHCGNGIPGAGNRLVRRLSILSWHLQVIRPMHSPRRRYRGEPCECRRWPHDNRLLASMRRKRRLIWDNTMTESFRAEMAALWCALMEGPPGAAPSLSTPSHAPGTGRKAAPGRWTESSG